MNGWKFGKVLLMERYAPPLLSYTKFLTVDVVGNSDPPIRPTSLSLAYYTKPSQKSRPVHDRFSTSRNTDDERYKRVFNFVRLRTSARILPSTN